MRTLGLAVLLALAVGAGCATRSTDPQPAAAIPVEVTEADSDQIGAAVQARKGNVILIDFWATWCGPCRARFPHLVDTHKKFADKGLVCMSVCLDKVGGWNKLGYNPDEVLKFLQMEEATFPNFAATDRNDDRLSKQFGLDGGIPFMTLFDKTGKRVWDTERQRLSDRALDQLIEAELAK